MELAVQTTEKIQVSTARINSYIADVFSQMNLPVAPAVTVLKEAMQYSATNGGKRFRPVLSLLVAEILNCDIEKVLPFAAAVEFIHTYSLIHDDLPCMDNDDLRRGQPTSHKVFGEATALLAGDALLTESFLLLSKNYSDHGALLGRLVTLLASAAGVSGMVGGQAIDLAAEAAHKTLSIDEMVQMHTLKTGCMIRVAVEGAAQIAGCAPKQISALKVFGEKLGLAFQIADDLLDHHEKGQEERSFVSLLGVSGTQKYLSKVSADALKSLREVSVSAYSLEYLINFNQSRPA